MDQQKIGEFLRELRKEKGLTQEELGEKFYVTSRTVSRWETGVSMPDLTILVELADFYDVDIRELINGERESENMDKETKDTLLKVAEYANAYTDEKVEKAKRKSKNVLLTTIPICTVALILYMLFKGETKGILYDAVPHYINSIFSWISLSLMLLCVPIMIYSDFISTIYDEDEKPQQTKHKKTAITSCIISLLSGLCMGVFDLNYGLLNHLVPDYIRMIIQFICSILFIGSFIYFIYMDNKFYQNTKYKKSKDKEKQSH